MCGAPSQCGRSSQPCTLTGTNLFLIDSVAADANFSQEMQVPDGFAGNALQVPHPVGGSLYVKLRDDPSAINTVVVPRKQLAQQASQAQPAAMPVSAPAPAQPDTAPAPQPAATAPATNDQPH